MIQQNVAIGVTSGILCAVAYALAMLLYKKAHQHGVRPYAQLIIGALFQIFMYGGLFFLSTPPDTATDLLLPAVGAIVAVIAQTCTVLAIYYGDASVQTPLMGTKVVFVSFLNVLFLGAALSTDMWIGTIAAAIAVFLLGWSRPRTPKHDHAARPLWIGVVFTLGAAFSFASLDIIAVRAVRDVDPLFVLPFIMVTSGVIFLLSYPFVGEARRLPTGKARRWLLAGASLFIGQTVAFGLSISYLKIPTVINIAYSSRALWSLLLVLLIGRAIGIGEATMERRTMVLRGAGALAVVGAISVIIV